VIGPSWPNAPGSCVVRVVNRKVAIYFDIENCIVANDGWPMNETFGKDLEGACSGVIGVSARRLPGRCRVNAEKPESGRPMFLPKFDCSTSW
jgi:hypothetical protein